LQAVMSQLVVFVADSSIAAVPVVTLKVPLWMRSPRLNVNFMSSSAIVTCLYAPKRQSGVASISIELVRSFVCTPFTVATVPSTVTPSGTL